jgi:hypothetical protein
MGVTMRSAWVIVVVSLLIYPAFARTAHAQSPAASADCVPFVWSKDKNEISGFWGTPKNELGKPLVDRAGRPYKDRLATPRFIGLEQPTMIVHGVDVSKYQTRGETAWEPFVDFRRVKDCQGSFAIIRVSYATTRGSPFKVWPDPAAAELWRQAAAAGLHVGPYHYFALRFPWTRDELMRDPGAAYAPAQLLAETKRQAASQAGEFVKALVGAVTGAGATPTDRVLPIALDIEQEWSDWAPNIPFASSADRTSEAVRVVYRMRHLYSVGICAWVKGVRANGLPSARVVLYTSPAAFDQYALGTYATADVGCEFEEFPLWVSWYRRQGQPHYAPKESYESKWIVEATYNMCFKSGRFSATSGRCVLHQYSEGGRLAFLPRPPMAGALDLNRLHLAQGQTLEQFMWPLRGSPVFAGSGAIVGATTPR